MDIQELKEKLSVIICILAGTLVCSFILSVVCSTLFFTVSSILAKNFSVLFSLLYIKTIGGFTLVFYFILLTVYSIIKFLRK